MKQIRMLTAALAAFAGAATAAAPVALQDNFESGAFASAWDATAGVAIQT
ncbi:MAG TPA: hypothetical protein P5022_07100 [Candidatus Paceibacterota bacterium]|nr:hypothetical protein [Candidatus Paceibacterota bacterium]